jgi:argonaute-like protein implicated in RNA metabolism and viral defense
MVIRKFREEFDICAAVMHSTVGQECYHLITKNDGSREYVIRPEKRGKFVGYLKNVALNKVLLTNNRWPFVLATSLKADMTIGIDVKLNTAGFTVVNKRGNLIRTIIKDSRQKEQLLAAQVKKLIVEAVQKEIDTHAYAVPLKSFVVHRDGILWPSERVGIQQALVELRKIGIIAPDALYAILEIPKKSAAPLRFYDVLRHQEKTIIENPEIGTYFVLDSVNAYVCATGRAFPRPGTVQPVHVRYVEGTLTFEHCLEDLFALTGLTWSRPEDCAKDPITIKLTDRRLGEDASTFDSDALEFAMSEAGQEAI